MTRVYLSNIREAWPIKRQEDVLDRAVPGWREMSVYRDELTKRAITRGAPLVQRDEYLLKQTGRQAGGGVLIVASLPPLARTPTDLAGVMMRLAARRETLRSIAEDVVMDPAIDDMEALKSAFQAASRRFSALGVSGGKASGEKAHARAMEAIERVKPFWGLLEPSTDELSKRFRVSRPTLVLYLGPRRAAQKEYQDDLRRQIAAQQVAEANRRRRKRGKEDDTDD